MSRTLTVEIDGTTVDSVVIDDVRITYGRQRVEDTVEPMQCTLTILTDMASWDYTVGLTVEVTATIGVTAYTRFIGTIGQVRTGRYTTEVIATSQGLGTLAHAPRDIFTMDGLGLTDYWIQWIYANGPFIADPNFAAGTVIPSANTQIGPSNALYLMQTVASWDVGGVVWEEQDGTVHYTTTADRVPTTPAAATIDADQVLDDWTAEQTVDSIVNQVTVNYTGGQLTVEDTGSIGTYGVYGAALDIPTSSNLSAYTIAGRRLAGNTIPTWQTAPIVLLLKTMSDAEAEDVLACTFGATLDLSAVAAILPGVPADAFLEGYEETIRNRCDDWQIAIYVSDVDVTRKPQSWNQVTASLAWSGVSGTLTWLQAIGVQL